MTDELRPELRSLAYLIGEWEGEGAGPTFRYREQVTVAPVLKGRYLSYRGAAYAEDDGRLMHNEEGYIGWDEGRGAPYAMFVYPFGVVERADGTLKDQVCQIETTSIVAIPPDYPFRWLDRRIEPTDDGWMYTLRLDTGRRAQEEHAVTRLRLHPAPPPPLPPMIATLARVPDAIAALLIGWPEDMLRRRPAPDAWSPKEIACHLRDAIRINHQRLFLTATHEQPYLPAYDENALARDQDYQNMPAADILPEIRMWRDETVFLLKGLAPDDWSHTATWENVGTVTLTHLVADMIMHEHQHLEALARLLDGPHR